MGSTSHTGGRGTAWRRELHDWAGRCLDRLSRREGVLGVLLGGSLARGQEWLHSDLEAGLLLEAKDPGLPHFNIMEDRGVEVFQLIRKELAAEIDRVVGGDITPLARWPIQLWKSRVILDPTGLLGRFKTAFDRGLFAEQSVAARIADIEGRIAGSIGEALGLLAEGRPRAAHVKVRHAMNEAILALHWSCGELPRSQNRTDSRLRRLCARRGTPEFYRLYREVFGLAGTAKAIRHAWPRVRDTVFEIAGLWGDSARDFFRLAVDGRFEWGHDAGILTVYRLYIPVIGGDRGIFGRLDDPEWSAKNGRLLEFLGLDDANSQDVFSWAKRIQHLRFTADGKPNASPSTPTGRPTTTCRRHDLNSRRSGGKPR